MGELRVVVVGGLRVAVEASMKGSPWESCGGAEHALSSGQDARAVPQ